MTELAPHGGCNWKGCQECFPREQRSETEFYDVTISFRVPKAYVESKTPQEWWQTFLTDGKLDPLWLEQNYASVDEFDHGEVAKVLACNYIGALDDYVSGYETMETDVEKTWEED